MIGSSPLSKLEDKAYQKKKKGCELATRRKEKQMESLVFTQGKEVN